jgi:hypothetical protein
MDATTFVVGYAGGLEGTNKLRLRRVSEVRSTAEAAERVYNDILERDGTAPTILFAGIAAAHCGHYAETIVVETPPSRFTSRFGASVSTQALADPFEGDYDPFN